MNLFINSSKYFLDRTFGEWISHDLLLSILGFFGSLLILTALKSLLNRIVHKREFKSKVLFNVLLNWIYLIAVFVLISVYFSESSLLNITVFTLGESEITILLLLIAVFIIIFSLKLSAFVRTYIFPTTFNKYQLDIGTQFTFSSIFHYFILVIAIFISLNTLGINITSLTVFAGVLGVGIGFGMQNIVSNFISGIIILFERPIKVGDRVVLDEYTSECLFSQK